MLIPNVFIVAAIFSTLVAGIPVASADAETISARGWGSVLGGNKEKTIWLESKPIPKRQYGHPHEEPLRQSNLPKVPYKNKIEIQGRQIPRPSYEKRGWGTHFKGCCGGKKEKPIEIQGKPIPKGQPGHPHVESLRPSNLPKVPHKKKIEIQGRPIPMPHQ